MPRHPVSPKGVLLIVLLDLFKVRKMNNFNYDLLKVSKMYFLKLGVFLVLMHMYIFLWWCFFMVKNCYKFSKMGIHGSG